MSRLAATLIDVGWGDSIFLECERPTPAGGTEVRYALIDSNDTPHLRSSYQFIRRHLEKQSVDLSARFPLFDFVLLTHAHSDHLSGLQALISALGTDWLWYPKSDEHGAFAKLVRYANRYRDKVQRHMAIDQTTGLPPFAEAELSVLWPPRRDDGQPWDSSDPNNNSVVLLARLDRISFLLTGDCEADNWPAFAGALPESGLRVVKIPHHGAHGSLFDAHGATPWLDRLGTRTLLGLSSHVRPHDHPDPAVISTLESRGYSSLYRTDRHYHVTFETTGAGTPSVKWAR